MAEDVLVGRATILIASPLNYGVPYRPGPQLPAAGRRRRRSAFFDDEETIRTITDRGAQRYVQRQLQCRVFQARAASGGDPLRFARGFGRARASHGAASGAERDQVSIAVSCNFDLASVQRLSLVYKTNHRLRSFGFKLVLLRDGAWPDEAKVGARRPSAKCAVVVLRPRRSGRRPAGRRKSSTTPEVRERGPSRAPTPLVWTSGQRRLDAARQSVSTANSDPSGNDPSLL